MVLRKYSTNGFQGNRPGDLYQIRALTPHLQVWFRRKFEERCSGNSRAAKNPSKFIQNYNHSSNLYVTPLVLNAQMDCACQAWWKA